MAKRKVSKIKLQADYFVTGVWMGNNRMITHMLLHSVENETEWTLGIKTSVEEILGLVDDGKTVRTMRWSYVRGKWVTGLLVKAANHPEGGRVLVSGSENIITQNLDHLIVMHTIV